MPDSEISVRLATQGSAQGSNCLAGNRGVQRIPEDKKPALLISFAYLKNWLKNQPLFCYRDWVMDSGAYSAHNSNRTIDIWEYIDCCKKLLATDPTLTEVFALDVIGDWQSSAENCRIMWENGVPAIPCFHADEPEEALVEMASKYPKIALGGVALVNAKRKLKWAEQCFSRVWPKKIHGFAYGGEDAVMRLPWHSVDATSWEMGPCGFGRWKTFGAMKIRGSQQNLRAEVEWYLELEKRAREKWRPAMKKLDDTELSVRLAVVTPQKLSTRQETAFHAKEDSRKD